MESLSFALVGAREGLQFAEENDLEPYWHFLWAAARTSGELGVLKIGWSN